MAGRYLRGASGCIYQKTEEGTFVVTAYQAVLRCGGAVFAGRYMHDMYVWIYSVGDMLFAVHACTTIT